MSHYVLSISNGNDISHNMITFQFHPLNTKENFFRALALIGDFFLQEISQRQKNKRNLNFHG